MAPDFPFSSMSGDYFTLYWIFFAGTILLSGIGFWYIIHLFRKLKATDNGSQEMQRIHQLISLGSKAFLKRQYQTAGIVLLIVFVILLFVNMPLAISFLIGAGCSIIASYVAMIASTMTNVKVTQAATKSLDGALRIGFNAGMIIGVAVISISLVGIAILYMIYNYSTQDILGFAFGASFASIFAQLGGGIFTKAADVGADLVGKLEQGFPEDDPRNPAAIADNVGDNVGDCAGRGADLFESSSANNIGAMIIGAVLSAYTLNPIFIIFSLVSRGVGNIAAMLGGLFVRVKDERADPIKALSRGISFTSIFILIGFFVLTWVSFGNAWWLLFFCGAIGIALGVSTYLIVNYYTSSRFRPVKDVRENSASGAGPNVIGGLSLGMESTAIPVITFVVGILVCFYLGQEYAIINGIADTFIGGIFGVAMATISLLAMTTIILAVDGFGPISDNAAGIAEMAHLGEDMRSNLDRLDAVGNTTKALAKGFGMTSAALSAIILFEAYLQEIRTVNVNIYHPVIMVSMLVGGLIPFIFSALAIRGTGHAASSLIQDIRNQFSAKPEILTGAVPPDYARSIDIATKSALRHMILPALISLLSPLIIGLLFGSTAIAAFLISATISGILLGFFMNTGGGALDNVKKAIETGLLGGKGSPAHAASVVGDTVGDPLKDTAGPSLHILIKVLNTISIAFAAFFLVYVPPIVL